MTNIFTENMWPKELDPIHQSPCAESIHHLLDLRGKTYRGFARIEENKGLLKPRMDLSSTHGQEAVRILVQRGLEEMAEAYDSVDYDHYLEELIDAVNYFWCLVIIDPRTPEIPIVKAMVDKLMDHTHPYSGNRLTLKDIGSTVVELNPIFEKLRHRAWMVNPQSQYFDGWSEVTTFLSNNLCLIWDQFSSWEDFVSYFIAKDNVLQFRIQSKY